MTEVRLKPHWPENQKATPKQFRDWFVRCPREQQLEIAERLLDAQDTAHRCWVMNHDAMEHEARHLWTQNRRLRIAWRSAGRYREAFFALQKNLKGDA